jgi:hypothetical protein
MRRWRGGCLAGVPAQMGKEVGKRQAGIERFVHADRPARKRISILKIARDPPRRLIAVGAALLRDRGEQHERAVAQRPGSADVDERRWIRELRVA